MKTGIIIKPSVWLYGEDCKEATDELLMGWAVGILREGSGWLKVVTHYGYCGYIEKTGIGFCSQKKLQKRDESGQMVFIKRAFVDAMEEPKVRSKILDILCRGSFVKVLDEQSNGYRKVALGDGRAGYIPCVAYESRRDSDRYLYEENMQDYFLRQGSYAWQENLLRERLVHYAKCYLGTQYRWAGKTPMGIDCSGLMFMSYLMSGILIYRDAKPEKGYPVHEIPKEAMKPGDLLYFPGHIAMYIGNCEYIHATGNERSFGCVINSLSENDWNYRKDLAEQLLMVGSIFQ